MKSSRFLWHVGLCLSYEEDFLTFMQALKAWIDGC